MKTKEDEPSRFDKDAIIKALEKDGMKPDDYKKLRDAKLKRVKAKHEEDIIAGRTVYKSIGEETKRNKLQ